ncbi:MAG: T9SS type A sorting domain-containing protein [Bacteroidetes bacterium]|nr:T9SS type A sorting domain-containing protein [Bacteroidota bacterium]
MKAQLKNWLLPNNKMCFLFKNRKGIMPFLFFLFLSPCLLQGQIANFVSNGSFETTNCTSPFDEYKALGWSSIDSAQFAAFLYNTVCGNAPVTGVGYQMPRSGAGFIRVQLYCPTCPSNFRRSNIKNRLKQPLLTGQTYCVKMYVNVQDVSSKAIDGFGFYFGDNSLDTIIFNSRLPLTFLTPQVENPTGNIINDTMNWVPITGTFTANGTEKFLVIANFKSDVATNTAVANTSVGGNYSEYFIDDVSCINLNLPAYAGADIWGIPSNTVYLGRPQDVGIDEACTWYKLPNTTTVIDTAAGITVTVASSTNTYMVRQEICGIIKYDTVIVYASGVGITKQEMGETNFNLYPNPANESLSIECNIINDSDKMRLQIINSLGQSVFDQEIAFRNKITKLNITELPSGVYLLNFKSEKKVSINKRLIITR